MKEAEQTGEKKGLFAFRALFIAGPVEGPVRIGVSKAPEDQLRLMNRHCLLTSHLGFEGWSTSSGPPQRVLHAMLDVARRQGLLHPDPEKADTIMVPMASAIETALKIAKRCGVQFMTEADKTQAIAAVVDDLFDEVGSIFAGEQKPKRNGNSRAFNPGRFK
ncbi:hypothetical protein [Hyphomicrobium sp.]|uniref:hypothetical protein n=1 Tax=Hyphomicrobium sp. TaxID=82 RepID=UPI001D31511D|nr:hypothetical protein [Hyphomicrobium sp.]MBY0561473.1 hypothetical protein [Hyphomicrobium sp.]